MTVTQDEFPEDKIPSIKRVMMPRDTNAVGTIFGGVILAEIDLAALSLPEESLLDSDVVLWRDRLQWTQGRDTDYSDADLLPIVTFGEHCSFADLGLRHLRAAGVRHEVVLEVISREGMRDALASGVGVALWNVSELDERHVRCDLSTEVPEPGDVVGVVRARRLDGDAEPDPGDRRDLPGAGRALLHGRHPVGRQDPRGRRGRQHRPALLLRS